MSSWSSAALLAGLTLIACEPPQAAKHPPGTAPAHQVDLPWPLPSPSTSLEIPAELRAPAEPGSHLSRAAEWLAKAFHDAGYGPLSFYDVPGGFALMAGLELTDDQGQGLTPADPRVRFGAQLPQMRFFTLPFWSELLANRKGRYRLILIVVVDKPFGYSTDLTEGHLLWVHPSRELPLSRTDMTYDGHDRWYALVYEFDKPPTAPSAKLAAEPVDPAVHLEKSGILAALRHEAGK